MKTMIMALAITLIGCMAAGAEQSSHNPAQRFVISVEIWRLRAEDCRSRYVTFSPQEMNTLSDFVMLGVNFAKFKPEDLGNLTKGLEFLVSGSGSPTEDQCKKLHDLLFLPP